MRFLGTGSVTIVCGADASPPRDPPAGVTSSWVTMWPSSTRRGAVSHVRPVTAPVRPTQQSLQPADFGSFHGDEMDFSRCGEQERSERAGRHSEGLSRTPGKGRCRRIEVWSRSRSRSLCGIATTTNYEKFSHELSAVDFKRLSNKAMHTLPPVHVQPL
ncbi:hypothetical protein E2C01_085449 [Portunus trituberculatus]|uniref:Uncharacterized protein n=1 Tax=Portunus trituberculatus TaxID=210409 RepID=A0A5B7IY25_PORTR|nr:hypothetical protein [Portunus trituberculatus]